MWKVPDDKGASVVHVLNVVKECMRQSTKQGGAHWAVAQAQKEFREETPDGLCAQASVVGYDVQTTLHDHHLNIIRCFKGYNITFYS